MKIRETVQHRNTMFISMVLFIVLGFLVNSTAYLEHIDMEVMRYIQKSENSALEGLAKAISFIGSAWGYMAIGMGLLVYNSKKRNYDGFNFYALTALSTSALNQILKIFYRRDRPFEFFRIEKSGFSFPSGHSMAAMGIYLAIAAILSKELPEYRKRIYAVSAILVLAIGWSRLYLGVHWPTDILGGYLGGIVAFTLVLNIEFKKK